LKFGKKREKKQKVKKTNVFCATTKNGGGTEGRGRGTHYLGKKGKTGA